MNFAGRLRVFHFDDLDDVAVVVELFSAGVEVGIDVVVCTGGIVSCITPAPGFAMASTTLLVLESLVQKTMSWLLK